MNTTSGVFRSMSPAWAFLLLLGLAGCKSSSDSAGPEGGSDDGDGAFAVALPYRPVQKLDLLFMIDNSASMLDKQRIFQEALPAFLRRLSSPRCVDSVTGELADFESCPAGYVREFEPVDDIHVGVVTSSLGGHGGPDNVCAKPVEEYVHMNDRGELLPNVRSGLPKDEDAGFLRWRAEDADDEADFADRVAAHIEAVDETGCAYEAPLEAWYRFLVDPDPPVDMMLLDDNQAIPTAINQQLLDQRAAFLRPDSTVAIVMLSDEDDCSIVDGETGWLAARAEVRMWPATEACDEDPNDPCCLSCALPRPDECPESPRCAGGRDSMLSWEDDSPNVRCEEQKRRFGFDFLYPPQRYISGLTDPLVPNRAGEMVPNPLYEPGPDGVPRDPRRVVLAGLVGVPWQDIATDASLQGDGLAFLTAKELRQTDRWSIVLGDPEASPPVPPEDPLMIVSLGSPRTGRHPITDEALVTADEAVLGNSINGHEYIATDDRQYACIFELPEPDTCEARPLGACDCTQEGAEDLKSPLCYAEEDSEFEPMQHSAKAYPAPRMLSVLKGMEDNGVVASVCPKSLEGSSSDDAYGYNPAFGALLERLKESLSSGCLPRELDLEREDQSCAIVEVVLDTDEESTACERAGRRALSATLEENVRRELMRGGCSLEDPNCERIALCAIEPLTGEEREVCWFEEDTSSLPAGYCYIDPGKGPGVAGGFGDGCLEGSPGACTNPFADRCPANEQRLLRLVGDAQTPTPAPGAALFVACEPAPPVGEP